MYCNKRICIHVALHGKVLKSVAYKYLSLGSLAFEFLHDISWRIHPCFTDVLYTHTYMDKRVHTDALRRACMYKGVSITRPW